MYPMKKIIFVLGITLCCVAVQGNAANTGTYGPIIANETLYRIALKYRQQGVPVSQVMESIFEANPDAFDAGDMNRLKIGEILTIPDFEATEQFDTRQTDVQKLKVDGSELAPPGLAPAEPDLVTGAPVAAAISLPDTAQNTQMKVGPAAGEQQITQGALPEPKPAKRKKKAKSDAPVFRYSYDIAFIDDDNVRLAQEDEDIRSDRSISATVRAKGGKSLDKFSILNYGASATYNKLDTFETLDNYEVEANVRYRFALTSSFSSPIYSLAARIGGREFDTEMRDASFVALSADLSNWITTTINMTTGVGLNAQESKSEVFDTSEARIFVNFDTNFSKTDLVYTTFTYITGDTVSSATPSLGIINVAEAIEADDAFGGIDANQFAYRLKADTVVLTLGYNRIFTPDLSFDVSARFVESEAQDDGDITYERTIIRASLLGRF